MLLVRCAHRHTSQPFSSETPLARKSSDDWDSVPSTASGAKYNHYVVCFDCGKKLAYDWERMRIVK